MRGEKLSTESVHISAKRADKRLTKLALFLLPLFAAGIAHATDAHPVAYAERLSCYHKMRKAGEKPAAAGEICGCFFRHLQAHPAEWLQLQAWRAQHPKEPLQGILNTDVTRQATACIAQEKAIAAHPRKYEAEKKHNAEVTQFNAMVRTDLQHMVQSWLAAGAQEGQTVQACAMRVTFDQSGNVLLSKTPQGQNKCPYWLQLRTYKSRITPDQLWHNMVHSTYAVTVHIASTVN